MTQLALREFGLLAPSEHRVLEDVPDDALAAGLLLHPVEGAQDEGGGANGGQFDRS